MSRLSLGLLAGLLYGALSAASMLPLEFPDKRAALLGAFLNRLAIGLVIGAVVGAPQVDALRLPPWVIGLAIGVLEALTYHFGLGRLGEMTVWAAMYAVLILRPAGLFSTRGHLEQRA